MLIGLFGGTFDPPHLGHLALSREALSDLSLDRLLWLLTPNPPHKIKQDITPLSHRLAMVIHALEGTPFELSRLDIDRPGPHYAVDTVELLRQQNPKAKIAYLMGSDSLNDLPTWHHPAELVKILDLIGVMGREGENPDLEALDQSLPGLRTKVRFIKTPRVDISASMVREKVRDGEPFEYMLPESVARYIQEKALYLPTAATTNTMKH